MTPALKRVILLYTLILPGFSLMMFAFSRYPSNSVPVWIPIGWGFYMLATITFMTLFGPRIFKSPSAPAKPPVGQASSTARAAWLIAVWSVLFLYGAFKFAKGDFPAERAIPSGALLFAFILVFSWLMRRDMKSQRAATNAPRSNGDDSLDLLH
jgi:hypothetical protein